MARLDFHRSHLSLLPLDCRVAIPLSTARRLEQGQSRRELLRHALRRAVIIFALGFSLNSSPWCLMPRCARGLPAWLHNYATTVRVPGVLQRIAICYFLAMTVFLGFASGGNLNWIVGLLAGYWALMIVGPLLAADRRPRATRQFLRVH